MRPGVILWCMRMWWRSGLKALGIACVVFFAGTMAQTLHQDGCPVTDPTCSSTSPTEGHVVLFTALAFLLAFGAFLFRAIKRKRTWGS